MATHKLGQLPSRNYQVFIVRWLAEMALGATGPHLCDIRHRPMCPAIAALHLGTEEAMRRCDCRPCPVIEMTPE